MSLLTVLCFTLAISCTFGDLTTEQEQLLNKVAQGIVRDLKAAGQARNRDVPVGQLVNKNIAKYSQELQRLVELFGDKEKVVGMVVGLVASNPDLQGALPSRRGQGQGQLKPRVIGAAIMGTLQLITDGIKMSLTRY